MTDLQDLHIRSENRATAAWQERVLANLASRERAKLLEEKRLADQRNRQQRELLESRVRWLFNTKASERGFEASVHGMPFEVASGSVAHWYQWAHPDFKNVSHDGVARFGVVIDGLRFFLYEQHLTVGAIHESTALAAAKTIEPGQAISLGSRYQQTEDNLGKFLRALRNGTLWTDPQWHAFPLVGRWDGEDWCAHLDGCACQDRDARGDQDWYIALDPVPEVRRPLSDAELHQIALRRLTPPDAVATSPYPETASPEEHGDA